jgi:hypothetical protein
VLQQREQQAAQGGGGGLVAGEQQQQELLHHVGIGKGETGLIQPAGQQIEAAGRQGRSGGGRRLGPLEHRRQPLQQAPARTQGTGVGAAGQGEREREQAAGPGFEVDEQGIPVGALKAQHRGGDHLEGKAPQPRGERGRSTVGAQLLAELVHQRHDPRAIALQGHGGEQLAHHPAAGLVIGAVAVGERQRPQQHAHALGPPALHRLGLGEQISHRPPAAHEYGALTEQGGFEHIAVALETGAGEVRVAKESQGFEQAAHRRCARQGQQRRGSGRHAGCA